MEQDRQIDSNVLQRFECYNDEIELMDLLKVLWKWKYLMLAGTLFCAIVAAVVSLNMTRVWAITTILQPGTLKVTDDGKTVYIDSAENIKTIIETGALNGRVLKDVQFPEKEEAPTSPKFEVTILKNTNALKVTYEIAYLDIGMQIMKNLNEGLLERYGKMVTIYQESYKDEIRQEEKHIFELTDKIAKLKNGVSLAEANTMAKIKQLTCLSG